jgi:acid phosphatase
LFKKSTTQRSEVFDKSKLDGTPSPITEDVPVRKGWYERIFGGSNLASMKSGRNSPVGIARQKVGVLPESDRAKLDGYYVRIRYNDKVMKVPGCKVAGKHLDGDESFCTLASIFIQASIFETNCSPGSI